MAATENLSLQLRLQQTLFMAATDSIYGCNRLYLWLQLTLRMAATDCIQASVTKMLQSKELRARKRPMSMAAAASAKKAHHATTAASQVCA